MKYLGLDLSTVSTGYAILEDSNLVESGQIQPDESMDTMARIIYTCNKLIHVLQTHQPDKVIIEDTYYGRNAEVFKMLSRLGGCVYYALSFHSLKTGMPIEFVKTTQARKSMGMLSKSNKKLVIAYVNSKFNLSLTYKDNDEADAIVTAYCGFYKSTQPDEVYKKSQQEFYKTKVRGLKTPSSKGTKNAKRKINKR